ncbi:MAG: Flagellar basal-body rod modification protein FlgD, partial [uncultured Propionibacteriaceae bacterium]
DLPHLRRGQQHRQRRQDRHVVLHQDRGRPARRQEDRRQGHVPQAARGPDEVPGPQQAGRLDAVPRADGDLHAGREARRDRRRAGQHAVGATDGRGQQSCRAHSYLSGRHGCRTNRCREVGDARRQRSDPAGRRHGCAAVQGQGSPPNRL